MGKLEGKNLCDTSPIPLVSWTGTVAELIHSSAARFSLGRRWQHLHGNECLSDRTPQVPSYPLQAHPVDPARTPVRPPQSSEHPIPILPIGAQNVVAPHHPLDGQTGGSFLCCVGTDRFARHFAQERHYPPTLCGAQCFRAQNKPTGPCRWAKGVQEQTERSITTPAGRAGASNGSNSRRRGPGPRARETREPACGG